MKQIIIVFLLVSATINLREASAVFRKNIPRVDSQPTTFSVHNTKETEIWLQGKHFTTQEGYFHRIWNVELNLMVSENLASKYPIIVSYLQLGVVK